MNTYSANTSVVINAPLQQTWDALTRPELVKQYFFNTELVTDWKVGSPVLFRGEWEGKPYEDKGTVLEFEPQKLLAFNYWSSFSGLEDKPELYQIIRYEVEPEGEGIRVTVTQSNADTQERADDSAKNWNIVLEGMKSLLEK